MLVEHKGRRLIVVDVSQWFASVLNRNLTHERSREDRVIAK